MEATPRGIDYGAVKTAIEMVEGVKSVHDLHIWAISTESMYVSVHVVCAMPETQ